MSTTPDSYPGASVAAKVIYFSGEIPLGDPEGDQKDLFRKLHLLSKERDHAILAVFLETVTASLRDEVKHLPGAERDVIPKFESVLDLTDHVVEMRKTPLGSAVERVLCLVFQLGSLIAYHEARPLEYDFNITKTYLIGRGPGLLSAAAIALSPSLTMIPSVVDQITRVAFRFGIVVDQVCRSLEVAPEEINTDGAWVYCAHGAKERDAQEAVAKFNMEKSIPATSTASVFNVDGRAVSVNGPPSTLEALFSESEYFQKTKNVPMKKIQGFWHSARAYAPEYVRQIVPTVERVGVAHFDVISPATGLSFGRVDSNTLLESIMEEMLTQEIRWHLAIATVTDQLKSLSPDSVSLISIQPSHYLEGLLNHWKAEILTASLSSQEITPEVMRMKLETSRPRDTRSSKLAVVGQACRFPGGADTAERFWELLVEGRDLVTTIPPDRFDAETHVDPTGTMPNTSKTPYGCFVENPGLFDAMFFGISPREAEQTDPMQRLAIVTAYEAMEHAGYVKGRGIDKRRVGTFYGQASDDYGEVNAGQEVGTYFIPGRCRAFGPGRINYAFDFWGPSFSIDTACSSSLAAIQVACTALWAGDVDMAVAGGMNILTNSDLYAGLSAGHFLSSTGNCKTWDENADGYCRSDGVGSVVLKRLEDAEKDNDNILAVVLSAATNHSAEAVSITHPHDQAQAQLYNQVARRAGIDPLAVGYVEMHGTGTQAGDKTEMKSVTSVFAPENGRRKTEDIPLYVGTVKSNTGHGEAAAGIMAFIKTMLVFQKGAIPPHVGIKTKMNPALPDLTTRNVIISKGLTSWDTGNKRKLAMVNNFGAAGGNTSMIIEEAPHRPRVGEDPRQGHILTVSAKSASSFQENLRRLVTYLQTKEDVSLGDLAYTLSARRAHYNYRVSIVAKSRTEAIQLLQPSIETALDRKPVSSKPAPIAFLFTGQGTFYIGIAKQLYQTSSVFQQRIKQLDNLAQRQGFPSFRPVIEGTCQLEDVSTAAMHLAIVGTEIALARLWTSFGVTPDVVIGHSLGEYAALAVAGVLSDSAAVFLVGTRALLLDSKCTPSTHGMLSVRASVTDVEAATKGLAFEVACVNGPNEIVLGGSSVELEALTAMLGKAGHRTFRLPVAHAYHTRQMNILVEDFVHKCRSVVCNRPRIPIISPRHAKVLSSLDSPNVSYLAEATRETVDFAGALENASETGVVSDATIWIELGHHPTLCGFVNRTLPSTRLACSSLHRDEDSWTTMGKSMSALYNAGVTLDWTAYHRPFEQALRLVDAPTYAWNNKNYWIQYRGNWNLTKGRLEGASKPANKAVNGFSTTSIHEILSEKYENGYGKITAQTSITHPCLQDVVDGHAMNGYGVASSFLHADMAFTMAKRILDEGLPNSAARGINVRNFKYHEAVVKQLAAHEPQPVQITVEAQLDKLEAHLKWYNPAKDMWYCDADVRFEDPSTWLADWSRTTKLITSRIETLGAMCASGVASKVTTDLAYSLFGKLVDYNDLYRTMQSVIFHEDEAFAEVVFPEKLEGTWTVPPNFIDGCVSLSGFILNGGTHFDNTKNFYITPAWKSMRFAKPMVSGGRYQAYVRMVPADGHSYAGDVYILQDGEIIGLVEAILFLELPRVMLNRLFSPHDVGVKRGAGVQFQSNSKTVVPTPHPAPAARAKSPDTVTSSPVLVSNGVTTPGLETPGGSDSISISDSSDIANRGLEVVAQELAVDIAELKDEVELASLGLDSLMSLVLSHRLRDELGIEMRDAFFLEVDTIAGLKKMLA